MWYVSRNGLLDERTQPNVFKEGIYSVMDKYALIFIAQSSGYGSLFIKYSYKSYEPGKLHKYKQLSIQSSQLQLLSEAEYRGYGLFKIIWT